MRKQVVDYTTRYPQLLEELKTKTLTQAEKDRGIVNFDYTGVGYGYNLKAHYPKNLRQARRDMRTPAYDKFEKIVKKLMAEEAKAQAEG